MKVDMPLNKKTKINEDIVSKNEISRRDFFISVS